MQLCSIEIDCASGSVIAATLANSGICPLTNERVLSPEAVQYTLSLMHSCGMYDLSGEFAFKVGLPAKSSISGVTIVVVPNVMGLCLFSPLLDHTLNSIKGMAFCEKLVSQFNFHNYDSLIHLQSKEDPRRFFYGPETQNIASLLFSAFNNDVTALRRVFMRGVKMNSVDYDGRTALHIAAAEGHLDTVRFLMEEAGVTHSSEDRFGFTPLDEARRFGHKKVEEYLLKKLVLE